MLLGHAEGYSNDVVRAQAGMLDRFMECHIFEDRMQHTVCHVNINERAPLGSMQWRSKRVRWSKWDTTFIPPPLPPPLRPLLRLRLP